MQSQQIQVGFGLRVTKHLIHLITHMCIVASSLTTLIMACHVHYFMNDYTEVPRGFNISVMLIVNIILMSL